MVSVAEAITWDGRGATLLLFVVAAADAPTVHPVNHMWLPREVRTYDLEDAEELLGGRVVRELDVRYDAVPEPLGDCVTAWLRAAVGAGAELAWFAFEGSFHFEHLLTPDIAGQVFGIADAGAIALALDDDHRKGPDWVAVLDRFRRAARLPAPLA